MLTQKYAYNQLGQRILDDRSMPNGNVLARFFYNTRLELVKSVRDRGGCGPDEVHTYAYDLNHNWTKKDGVSYTNNIADQLLAVAGGGSLSYNDSGQATDVQGWDVTYNCADQITGIIAPGKNIAYRYDGAGQRVEKTVNGVTQKFLWNGGDICKEYRADGSVRADYFLGAGREGIKTNGQWHWYLSDIQGSTLMLTDASGHSAATYDYSDYGETRQTSGSTALYNPFLYTGQEYDFETSLYHLRARHYSPDKGRFFSRDPIGYAGGSNMYAYCGADPIDFSDPSGLFGFAYSRSGSLIGTFQTATEFHTFLTASNLADASIGGLRFFGHANESAITFQTGAQNRGTTGAVWATGDGVGLSFTFAGQQIPITDLLNRKLSSNGYIVFGGCDTAGSTANPNNTLAEIASRSLHRTTLGLQNFSLVRDTGAGTLPKSVWRVFRNGVSNPSENFQGIINSTSTLQVSP